MKLRLIQQPLFHFYVFIGEIPAAPATNRRAMKTLHAVPSLIALLVFGSFFAETARAFDRSSFPANFFFGAATSSYQNEGAAFEDGKGQSIWDNFTHQYPEKILDRSNGDVAQDFYHRYKEDVKLMKFLGLNGFRMSISWPRILPNGKLSGGVNKKGIAFYNNVFNELLASGVTPFVTLFHWDLPQALEDEYKGFLSPRIVDDFRDFAGVCFKEFGDRVKHWITLNEPLIFTSGGYDGGFVGTLAPGRCSDRSRCAEGNSATEPYIVGHNQLLSHAAAVKLYRDKFKVAQKGEIGITMATQWMLPFSKSRADAKATQRSIEFINGWFLDPVVYGRYPRIMRSIVRDRLPRFTKEQSDLLKGSYDFLGFNYYTSNYAAHESSPNTVNISSSTDSMVRLLTSNSKGVPIGEPTGSPAFFVYPEGLYDILVYAKKRYNDPTIYITENGYASQNNGTLQEGLNDSRRSNFLDVHLQALHRAIKAGVKVKGYLAWSFLDDFEWNSGFTLRFGIVYVDYKNGLKRILKDSALWFKRFLLKQ